MRSLNSDHFQALWTHFACLQEACVPRTGQILKFPRIFYCVVVCLVDNLAFELSLSTQLLEKYSFEQ